MQAAPKEGYQVPEHQRRVDEMFAAARAETQRPRPHLFKPPPPRPTPSKDPLDHRLAEEIEFLRRRLDQIAGVLSSDRILVHRYGTTLQSLDLMNQIMGHLARVISSEEKDLAVDQISLGDLAGRLKRKPLSPLNSSVPTC